MHLHTHLITEELHLVATVKKLIQLLLWLIQHQLHYLYLVCMMHYVTKAMPNYFINSKKPKSCRTRLTNHTGSMSHHIMPLVINALMVGRQTDIPKCEQKQFQESKRVLRLAHSRFKNQTNNYLHLIVAILQYTQLHTVTHFSVAYRIQKNVQLRILLSKIFMYKHVYFSDLDNNPERLYANKHPQPCIASYICDSDNLISFSINVNL